MRTGPPSLLLNSVGQSNLKARYRKKIPHGIASKRGPQVSPYKPEVGKGEDFGQNTKASISLGIMFIVSMEWEGSSLFNRTIF